MHDAPRPALHLTPPAGWMNDPNGLRHVDGLLHVTYQHNPDEPRWGRMHWGHATTPDLVTWTHQPIALEPGDGVDAFGCWSGCIVVDDDGGANLFYTGVRLDGDLRRQSICRAVSLDGAMGPWRKDDANPLIASPPPGFEPDLFRDPFVFREGAGWAMLVGAGTTTGHGAVLLYRSVDLRAWSYARPILSTEELDPSLGADAPIWECPQLVRFGGTDLLIVSVVDRAPGIRPSHVTAIVGRLAGDRFEPDRIQQLGMGPDFYAPAATVLPDGRCLLFGWIPEDPPGHGSGRTWAGSLTLPRVVALHPDGEVSLAIAEELLRCRRRPQHFGPLELAGGATWRRALPVGPVELAIALESIDAEEVAIELRDAEDDDPLVRVGVRAGERDLTVARAGIVAVAGRSSMTATTLPARDGPVVHLRLVLDGSILELEANGHTMSTARLPDRATVDPIRVEIGSTGGRARVDRLELFSLSAG